jgi:hypothetical protein
LKPLELIVLEQEMKVQVVEERDVVVKEGDEVLCLVRGVARPFGGGHEVEIRDAKLVQVVEVRSPNPARST